MNAAPPPLDPGRCPLCGGANGCAMAAGDHDAPCWCTQVGFAPELLARVPAAARGLACICRRCAKAGAEAGAGDAAAPDGGR
ncbi:MAG: cysteine-rich CWC family protein [Burkholderiaceae bacterium]